jgi:hypothetical protein
VNLKDKWASICTPKTVQPKRKREQEAPLADVGRTPKNGKQNRKGKRKI